MLTSKNPRSTKEEDKSYLKIFVAVSFILVAVTAWVIVNETVDRRPWKEYQKQFYRLECEKIKENYQKELAVFESPDIQKKYGETKKNLERAWEDFKKPAIQDEYHKLSEEIRKGTVELETLKFRGIVARNEGMEKEYLYGMTQDERIKRELEELEATAKECAVRTKDLEGKISLMKARLEELKSKVDACTEEIETYTSGLEKYRAQLKAFQKTRPSLQVYQTSLEDLNVVDRCMSCHVGINKTEAVSAEQPYASHPDQKLYLGNHPPERFGCVLCHDGQASATSSVEKAHGEVEYWLTPLNEGTYAQASCIRCHKEGREVKGGDVLWRGKRLFDELGCYGCHDTAGFGEDKHRM
jgi:Nitrate reductase cytochrome c-type subunit (NapB).